MQEMILRCHEALEQVEKAPMLNLGRAVSVVRMTLAMATDLNARLERLEKGGRITADMVEWPNGGRHG